MGVFTYFDIKRVPLQVYDEAHRQLYGYNNHLL